MPSIQRSSAENPITGAGIIRYFNEERGVKIDPMVFVGLTVAFIVLEILLNIV
jgi:preprotein translocase subunit Sec61beta